MGQMTQEESDKMMFDLVKPRTPTELDERPGPHVGAIALMARALKNARASSEMFGDLTRGLEKSLECLKFWNAWAEDHDLAGFVNAIEQRDLTAIGGLMDWLEDRSDDPRRVRQLQVIEDGMGRLLLVANKPKVSPYTLETAWLDFVGVVKVALWKDIQGLGGAVAAINATLFTHPVDPAGQTLPGSPSSEWPQSGSAAWPEENPAAGEGAPEINPETLLWGHDPSATVQFGEELSRRMLARLDAEIMADHPGDIDDG